MCRSLVRNSKDSDFYSRGGSGSHRGRGGTTVEVEVGGCISDPGKRWWDLSQGDCLSGKQHIYGYAGTSTSFPGGGIISTIFKKKRNQEWFQSSAWAVPPVTFKVGCNISFAVGCLGFAPSWSFWGMPPPTVQPGWNWPSSPLLSSGKGIS